MLAVGRKDGEAERQRRVRYVAAANVEGPGNRGGVGQHGMRGAFLRDRGSEPCQLVLGKLAGKSLRVQFHRSDRRIRLIIPDDVDRVFGCRYQFRARFCRRGFQCLYLADRVQPWIETKARTLAEIFRDPGGGRVVDQAFDREDVEIDLGAHLQRVAAVDKDEGAIAQHDSHSGRAAEAGQPAQPCRAVRNIFALMLVGTGHQETIEAILAQPATQPGDMRFAHGGIAGRVESLEHRCKPVIVRLRGGP